jgi:hypothetical protein
MTKVTGAGFLLNIESNKVYAHIEEGNMDTLLTAEELAEIAQRVGALDEDHDFIAHAKEDVSKLLLMVHVLAGLLYCLKWDKMGTY